VEKKHNYVDKGYADFAITYPYHPVNLI
jgi:hypothetical protein